MDMVVNREIPTSALRADGDDGLGSGLALLMDELAHGVLVTTLESRLLHANHAACQELGRRRVLGTRNNLLQPCTREGARILHDALAGVGDGKRCLIELPAASGPGLTVAVLPLKTEAPHHIPRAALLFSRASVCESLMLGFFARTHGLTATEENVLRILCQGFSAPQVAQQLKVAVSTVRSHVRSLCGKTRTCGVRELVNRVAVLPPVAPALWHEPLH